MVDKLQRPLVIGSVSLALVIGILELMNQTLGEWSIYTLFAFGISAGVWWVQQQSKSKAIAPALPKYVDSTLVKQTLTEAERVIDRLKTEVDEPTPANAAIKPQVSLLESQVNQITSELDRESLRLLVMGSKGSGKTSLVQQLQSWQQEDAQPVTLYEAPSFAVEMDGRVTSEAIALKQAMTADLVLFLVTGDLTDSELQTLKQLAIHKRTLLIFNKQDQYLPNDRHTLLTRMQTWVKGLLPTEDVIAIATDPRPLKVRKHEVDGVIQEWLEDQQPDVSSLTQRLNTIVKSESQQLVLASSLSHAKSIKTQAATALNEVRRTRALPLVEQFQWITAGTAFASPIPTLDVVATVAINVQMIVDLGKIYQQSFSIDQAQKVVTTLGSLILKLGLVELSTRAVSSLLKTNAITYIAGGCIQAVSAAYLTRIAGLALIEYFHTQEPNLTMAEAKPLAIERLGEILQRVFQQNQQTSIFQTLTRQVFERFTPKAAQHQQTEQTPPILPLEPIPEVLQPVPLKLPEKAIAETVPASQEMGDRSVEQIL